MNKLSKEKRDRLILTCIGIVGLLGLLYTFVLGAQKDQLAAIEIRIDGTKDKLSKAERLEKSANSIQLRLSESQKTLDEKEADMAPQGHYYWFLKLLEAFRQEQRHSDNFIVDITQPEIGEIGLIPNMPYKAANFGVRLTGEYREFGRFLAALENSFPYFRVQNVRLAVPGAGMMSLGPVQQSALRPGGENLIVELRVVTPIKPGTT